MKVLASGLLLLTIFNSSYAVIVPNQPVPKGQLVPNKEIPKGLLVPNKEIPKGMIVPNMDIPKGLIVDNKPVPEGMIVPNRQNPYRADPVFASDAELGATMPIPQESYPINLYKERTVGALGSGNPPTLRDFANPALAKMQDALRLRVDIGRAQDDVAKAAVDFAAARREKKDLDIAISEREKLLAAKGAALKDIITKGQQKNKDTLQAVAEIEKFGKIASTNDDKLKATQIVDTIKTTSKSLDSVIVSAQNTIKTIEGPVATKPSVQPAVQKK